MEVENEQKTEVAIFRRKIRELLSSCRTLEVPERKVVVELVWWQKSKTIEIRVDEFVEHDPLDFGVEWELEELLIRHYLTNLFKADVDCEEGQYWTTSVEI